MNKQLITVLNLLVMFVLFFSVFAYQTLAISSLNLGAKEITISNELKEAEVMTYSIELQDDIEGISYYIRSEDPSICWLRLYNSDGKEIYREDFGWILGRFIGRSETQVIESITSRENTLEIIAPSYHSCIYELHLTGLTKQKLATTPDTELYKTNQELSEKTSEVELLNEEISFLKGEVDELGAEIDDNKKNIENLEKEREELNNLLQKNIKEKEKLNNIFKELIKERDKLQAKVKLLTTTCYILIIIIVGMGAYYFYRHILRHKKGNLIKTIFEKIK